jgi:cell division protein FtsB
VKRSRAQLVFRFAGRLGATGVALLIAVLIASQFARAMAENISMAHQLLTIRSDVASLQKHRDEQERELRRLQDPQGAIPDIHERLRLVRPNEAIIFVSPDPHASP